mmetsp:Transcript_31677/g.100610  ORF Transcript_31677/g.100610 Transcript_31677/m.100610 type:complete len:97 (+) Transcript_31677:260-550(+)
MNALRTGMRTALRAPAAAARRPMSSSPLDMAGKTIFRSNITYVGYVVVGSVIMELLYGSVTEGMWNTMNSGKLYHQIDWSKWAFELDEEDEDEDDE